MHLIGKYKIKKTTTKKNLSHKCFIFTPALDFEKDYENKRPYEMCQVYAFNSCLSLPHITKILSVSSDLTWCVMGKAPWGSKCFWS